MRRWGWWVLAALVVGGGLLGLAAVNQVRARDDADLPLALPPPPSPEEAERTRIHIAVSGTENRLVEAQRDPEGWMLRVEGNAPDTDLAKLLETAHTLFTELNRTRAPMARVTAVFRTDSLKDVYGRPLKDVVIARLTLEKETFDRIHWQGFDPRNFRRVADEFWLHDLLMQQIPSLQEQEAGQEEAGSGGSGQGKSGG